MRESYYQAGLRSAFLDAISEIGKAEVFDNLSVLMDTRLFWLEMISMLTNFM